MTVEQLDAELTTIFEWWADRTRNIQAELEQKVEAAVTKAEGLPDHLVTASAEKMLQRIAEFDLVRGTRTCKDHPTDV